MFLNKEWSLGRLKKLTGKLGDTRKVHLRSALSSRQSRNQKFISGCFLPSFPALSFLSFPLLSFFPLFSPASNPAKIFGGSGVISP